MDSSNQLNSSLSGKNMKGEIPSGLNSMEALTELWLDGNSLTGQLPDMSNLINLQIVHLENNKLTGSLPSYLGSLPSLQELHIENNSFSGDIPRALLTGKVNFKYEDNPQLHNGAQQKRRFKIILGTSIAVCIAWRFSTVTLIDILIPVVSATLLYPPGDSLPISAKPSTAYSIARGGPFMDEGVAYYISLSELEIATEHFSKKIGQGSFGSVYYGKMKDGKEIAVKTMADSSSHATKQFVTEVALLSRIHHRNLVPLIGYCEEEEQRILVYEYMHNGTLRDRIHCSVNQKPLDWLARLQIAEDAAKGLDSNLPVVW
ncbi:hypothetical protein Pint_23625 [Pistacia integerrima]|uniref:Uncharacterized protein n=1 Tax=Pistacia integerrima TaxID=434235 RepID=A0ACC0YL34_9ROSI|nr:hypothetical protein Pint_23625 [Pistacia integerrima]